MTYFLIYHFMKKTDIFLTILISDDFSVRVGDFLDEG